MPAATCPPFNKVVDILIATTKKAEELMDHRDEETMNNELLEANLCFSIEVYANKLVIMKDSLCRAAPTSQDPYARPMR